MASGSVCVCVGVRGRCGACWVWIFCHSTWQPVTRTWILMADLPTFFVCNIQHIYMNEMQIIVINSERRAHQEHRCRSKQIKKNCCFWFGWCFGLVACDQRAERINYRRYRAFYYINMTFFRRHARWRRCSVFAVVGRFSTVAEMRELLTDSVRWHKTHMELSYISGFEEEQWWDIFPSEFGSQYQKWLKFSGSDIFDRAGKQLLRT